MRPVVAFAVLVLVVLAAGCGNGGGSDIEEARDAVRDYVTGIAEGDGDRSCGRMSEAAQETLDDEDLAPLRDPRIDVTLNRDKATASVADGLSDITVIKVDGEWLIDDG